MKPAVCAVIALMCLAAFPSAYAEEASEVVVLTDDTFDEYVKTHKFVLVEFYAPWCGHCKALQPKYNEAAELVKDSDDISLAKVDCTENEAVASAQNVEGYPTIAVFVDGERVGEYNGAREAKDIATYMVGVQSGDIDPAEDSGGEDDLSASESETDPDSKVVRLTEDNFEEFVDSKSLVVVEFYASWCFHCKMFKPEYEDAAKKIAENHPEGDVAVAKVEATENTGLAQAMEIEGFPTIKIFRNGKLVGDYEGNRESAALVEYVERQLGPAVKPLATSDELSAFREAHDSAILGLFPTEDEAAFFTSFAEENRNDFVFGRVADASLYAGLNGEAGQVLVSIDGATHVFPFAATKDNEADLLAFLRLRSLPVFGALGPETFMKYANNKVPLLLVFYGDGSTADKEIVESVAAEIREQGVVCTHVDADNFGDFKDELGIQDGELAVVILDYDNEIHFVYGDRPKSADGVKAFVADFKAGKLTPHTKSEEPPAENDGPVKVVVGTTFDEIVLDKSQDVLIEFYAPWCGHCKALAPAYEKLGEYLKDVEGVTIAKMDVTANDPPRSDDFEIEGIPTIKFVKKDGTVVDYEGSSRTLGAILDFIHEHATDKFVKPEVAEEDLLLGAGGDSDEEPSSDFGDLFDEDMLREMGLDGQEDLEALFDAQAEGGDMGGIEGGGHDEL